MNLELKQRSNEILEEVNNAPLLQGDALVVMGSALCLVDERFHPGSSLPWISFAKFLKSLEGKKIEQVRFVNLVNFDAESASFGP